jgi:hypothetical protein
VGPVWNHRVVRVRDGDSFTLLICEVYYDERGWAFQRNDGARVLGENAEELNVCINRMLNALSQPVLEDIWPQEP